MNSERGIVIAAVFVLGSMNGCAAITPPPTKGNFIGNAEPATEAQLASDSARQLAAIYPPAHTRFNMNQPALDPYGQALVGKLREDGYAVFEYAPAGEQVTEETITSNSALSLGYVLDEIEGVNLYRISLLVGENGSLTRAYRMTSAGVSPAGSWMRRQ